MQVSPLSLGGEGVGVRGVDEGLVVIVKGLFSILTPAPSPLYRLETR